MTHACPTCGDEFDSSRAMRVHHSRSHGEKLHKETTCNHCGETFTHKRDPTKPHKYCSVECAGKAKRDRVELECEYCGDVFKVPKSESDRKYCSTECGYKSKAKFVQKECEQCGKTHRSYPYRDSDYCSKACEHEARNEKPRPDSDKMLVWLFYVYNDYTMNYTYKRIAAHLGYENRLYREDVREIVNSNGWNRQMSHQIKGKADEVFGETPEGDDSWKELYSD